MVNVLARTYDIFCALPVVANKALSVGECEDS